MRSTAKVKPKLPRCQKGTHRSKISGDCEPKICPRGTRKNHRTDKCEPFTPPPRSSQSSRSSATNYVTPRSSATNYVTPRSSATNYVTPRSSATNYATPQSQNMFTPLSQSRSPASSVSSSSKRTLTPPSTAKPSSVVDVSLDDIPELIEKLTTDVDRMKIMIKYMPADNFNKMLAYQENLYNFSLRAGDNAKDLVAYLNKLERMCAQVKSGKRTYKTYIDRVHLAEELKYYEELAGDSTDKDYKLSRKIIQVIVQGLSFMVSPKPTPVPSPMISSPVSSQRSNRSQNINPSPILTPAPTSQNLDINMDMDVGADIDQTEPATANTQ